MTKLLSPKEIEKKLGISRSTLWRMERGGQFPPHKQLSINRIAWVESEIDEWIANGCSKPKDKEQDK